MAILSRAKSTMVAIKDKTNHGYSQWQNQPWLLSMKKQPWLLSMTKPTMVTLNDEINYGYSQRQNQTRLFSTTNHGYSQWQRWQPTKNTLKWQPTMLTPPLCFQNSIKQLVHCCRCCALVLQLNGAIPREMGGLHFLVELRLRENKLVGKIPPLLSNMCSVSYTHLTLPTNREV